jgi:hypothetical protein
MSKMSDNYPAMDSDSCDYNGLMGNCGEDCKALALGKCPFQEEMNKEVWKRKLESIKNRLKNLFPSYPIFK